MIMEKISISLLTEYVDNTLMFGIEVRDGGVALSYPTLTSNRDRIEEFISILDRNDFTADILPELVEDFLADLYGE